MPSASTKSISKLVSQNVRLAKQLRPDTTDLQISTLRDISRNLRLSLATGELLLVNDRWYITHAGLLRIACLRCCVGIRVMPLHEFCDPNAERWAFKAIVYKSRSCKGFVGYGDADPSNVSPLVHGAEMRIAETRAVNRALRKAYGIGICSVEEIGSFPVSGEPVQVKKLPPQLANGHSGGARPLRDRLCQIIRRHQLDAVLVKAYAADFCGVKSLREATREQVENFVKHLAGWVEKDRNALLCQLNSYLGTKEVGSEQREKEEKERGAA